MGGERFEEHEQADTHKNQAAGRVRNERLGN
jgi:hypothetical protein